MGDEKEVQENTNVLKGTIVKGRLEGEPFSIYFGESPAKTQVFVGDKILLCDKLVIEVNVNHPAIDISFHGYQIVNKK